MDKSDVVIIGGVAAGPKTGATLIRRMSEAKVTLFQKDELVSYGTCGMPYFASGDIDNFRELTLTSYGVARDSEFFKRTKGFEVVTGTEVIKIERAKKQIIAKNLNSGEIVEHGYGKLVLATGARPCRPPFPVPDSSNVRSFTRPDDAVHFRKMAEQGKIGKALIVGGGFIGCEMAEATASLWGIETILVEKEKQLLPYILDPEISRLVESEFKRQEIALLLGTQVDKIELNNDGNPIISIKGMKDIAVDYVFLCTGVYPETKLAREAGLTIGETGGIQVNSMMQTSDTDIYAGGDCVESYHRISSQNIYIPMGSLANRHGRVIAENIAGLKTEFPGVFGAFLIKVFDLNVGAVGLSMETANKTGLKAKEIWATFPDSPDYYPESKTYTLKMIYEEKTERLLGLQATGKGDICRRIDVFSSFLQNKATVGNLLDFEHGYAPPYSEALDPLHHLAGIALAEKRGVNLINPRSDFAGDVVWLDVREFEEVAALPWPYEDPDKNRPLINIPLNDLRERLKELDPSKKIMIICRRGPRSYQAALILEKAGFQKVYIIGGGTQAALS